MLEEKLRELGLSEKESAVYIAIVEAGKASPARIAKATGIKRPTVYAVGEELTKKGLIEVDDAGATTFYLPAGAGALKRVVEKEKQALETRKNLLESLAKEVEAMPRSKTYAVPRIQFIEHEENVEEFLYKQTAAWHDNATALGVAWWGFQDHTLVEHQPYLKWIRWSWEKAPESAVINLLSNNSQIEEIMKKNPIRGRNIKFWEGSLNFTATQWIIGDYSILIQTKQKPHYLVQIHDPVYCANMRELFKNLWKEV
jgi:sugar-specific transcriptional regulator TrmB